jgi:signal transduction histidine kinase
MTIRNPRGLPDTVGDYGRLLAAFAFVLANAVNRSPQGGSVSVRTQKTDGNMAEFICRDAGKSLSATELSHIFEPFRVNSDSFIANPVDFGVGFSLVRLTIEQHGGSITVKNAPHGGTLVKIRLPLASLA